MKKFVYITLILLSFSSYSSHASTEEIPKEEPIFYDDGHHELFSIEKSLCDHEHEFDENLVIPQDPLWKEWLTKIGCLVVAKCYAAKEYLDERYAKTKESLNRLSNYFYPKSKRARRRHEQRKA